MQKILYHFCRMQNYFTRVATVNDVEVITLMAQKIWRIHYPSIITNAQIEYMLEMMYSQQALLKQMREENHCFHLCIANDVVAGYCSHSNQGNGNYFLHKFYVDTTLHHRGIGSWFFKEVFDSIHDLQNLRLTVNRKNYSAINFYFKNGFIIEEVKDFAIGNGFWMQDFIMILKRSAKE